MNTNHAHYDAAMKDAGLLGANYKTLRNRKRALAVNLIRAAHVEDFKLEPLITDTKAAMKWGKLADDERNQLGVFFNAVRTISGAWPKLGEDVKTAFLAGEKIFSTLAKEIKDADKKANEPGGDNAPEADAPTADAPAPAPVPAPTAEPVDPILAMMRGLAVFVDETPMDKMSAEQLAALSNLADAIDEFRTKAKAKAAAPLAKVA